MRLSAIALAVLFIASCTKEAKISKLLRRGDGKWNIESYSYQEIDAGVVTFTESYSNAGNIVFDEDGMVIWTFTTNGDTDIFSGQWSNQKETITFNIDGETIVLNIDDKKKKKLTLSSSVTYAGTTENINLVIEKE